MKILGHELPSLLSRLVKNGECNVPTKKLNCKWLRNSVNVKVNFYNYDSMWGNTSKFLSEHDRAMLGHPDLNYAPGHLNPQQCVLIGILGLNQDQPIALDYRMNEMKPSVVTLQRGENPVTDNRWLKISDSFDEFAITIGLVNG